MTTEGIAIPAVSGSTRTPAPSMAVSIRRHRAAVTTLLTGGAALLVLFVLTLLDLGGNVVWWEIGHWTVGASVGFVLGLLGTRAATGALRRDRALVTAALGFYLLGQLLWDVQVMLGIAPVPAPSDIFYLGGMAPLAVAVALGVRARVRRSERIAFSLDTAVVVATILAALVGNLGTTLAVLWLLYPTVYLGLAAVVVLAAVTTGTTRAGAGLYVAAIGIALLGYDWVWYLEQLLVGNPTTGSMVNMTASIGSVLLGLGVFGWRFERSPSESFVRRSQAWLSFVPIAAILVSALVLALEDGPRGSIELDEGVAAVAMTLAILRQTLLLRDRTAFLDRERLLTVNAEGALAERAASEARYRSLVTVYNALAEQMTFAIDEDEMFRAAAAALDKLVPTVSADILVISASEDRLTVAVTWGDGPSSVDTIVDIDSPMRCLGMRRGAMHVCADVGDRWSQRCPAHPTTTGSLLCVPMMAAGKAVGVVHLARSTRNAFGEDDQRQAARIAEQVALAASNARLIRRMEGLALTDSLTGLSNGRFFDPFLDRELANAERDGIAIGLISIDVDHFKDFNDTHGHPAGDDALKAFARACRQSLRDSDTMARLGGEEFGVILRGSDLAASLVVAEKLRLAVEQTVVEIGPGRSARITASFGVAGSEAHGTDRGHLMKAADRAMYRAKREGRNRVVAADVRVRQRSAATASSA